MRLGSSLLGLLLAGCAATQPVTVPIVQPDAPVAVPTAQPLTLNPVEWQVLTLPQLQKLVDDLQKSNDNHVVLFVLDEKNYDNLTLNLIDIERYLKEQKVILAMLKKIVADRSAASQATP